MGLLTLEDLAISLGRTIETEEEAGFQLLIDTMTVFIENYCGVAFIPHESETVRYRADGRGIVELLGPVTEIETISVVLPSTGYPSVSEPYGPYYDNFSEIYYLPPYAVVDVTYTYGMDEVPEDIKSVATEAVKGVIEGDDNSTLDTYTVGDVTERFKQGWQLTNFNGMQQLVLDSYRGVATTWRV